MRRYVTLGDGRKVGLAAYVAAWKACRDLAPDTWIGRGVSGFGETAADALAALRRGMDDRINRHVPAYGRGRKWSSDWQRAARHLANAVNTPRLVVSYAPPEFRARLADRLHTDE